MRITKGGPLWAGRRRVSPEQQKGVAARCEAVRKQGDRALARQLRGEALQVERTAFRRAFRRLTPKARSALELACKHAGVLARRELAALKEFDVKPTSGVTLYQRLLPLDAVGILVPRGAVSVLLSAAIPAAVAGVGRRVVCTQPDDEGVVDNHVLAAAYMCGVTEVYRLGGVDAAAALAHGTASIAPVDRIVGAGDSALALAKRELSEVCGVDLCTGPTELLVLADETAPPEFVAADLAAQAEASAEAVCLLVTPSGALAERTRDELRRLQRGLPKDHPVRAPLRRARAAVVESLDEGVDLTNRRAPQRLSLMVQRPDELVGRLRQYGTLLVGRHCPAALGDRVTGASALLPGGGEARHTAGLGVSAFVRRVTVQQVDPSAYVRLSRAAATLAELEGCDQTWSALAVRLATPGQE